MTKLNIVAKVPGMNARDRRREIDRLTRRHRDRRPSQWLERCHTGLGLLMLLGMFLGFFWAVNELFGGAGRNATNAVGKSLLWLLQ